MMKFSTVPRERSRVPRMWAVVAMTAALSWAASPVFAQDYRDYGHDHGQDYGHGDGDHHDEHHEVRRDYHHDYYRGGYDSYYYQQPVYSPPVVYEAPPPPVGVNLIIPFHF